MKTIEIEEDVYEHLLRNAISIGETASDILRRLLSLPSSGPDNIEIRSKRKKTYSNHDTDKILSYSQTELSECLTDPHFRAQSSVLGRFLFILGWIYRRNPNEFSKVLTISGRSRKYFGRSSEELEQSGRSVMPQRIPDSPYWVTTNNDTPKKRRVLEDVLRVLEYSRAAIEQAKKTLG